MRDWKLAVFGAGLLASATSAEIVTVNVFDFDFSINAPDQPIVDAVVNIGDTVRWVFLDEGHSATSVGGIPEVFDSGIDPIGPYDHTFTNVGTWWYYCIPHGTDMGDGTAVGMAGTVTVVPGVGSVMMLGVGGLMGMRRRRR